MSGFIDSIGDALGDAVDFVGDVVGEIAQPVVSIASIVPGPWQVPALAINAGYQATQGNWLGALGSAYGAYGAYGAGGGFGGVGSSGGTQMLTAEQFGSLAGNPAAIQAYADAGMISPSMLSYGADQYALDAWESLPVEARNAYQDAGFSPMEIGSAALADGGSLGSGMLGTVKTGFDASKTINALRGTQAPNLADYLGTASGLLGSYLQGNQAKDAASTAALAQVEAAKIAAEAAKFKPIGVTTRFGSSQFGYDNAGNLVKAGYTMPSDIRAQQDALIAESNRALSQYQAAPGATAPMGVAGQRAMQLGQGYLGTTPQQQAAQYMAEQQGLLAPGRERDLATLQNKLLQQGRTGLATGGTSTGMMAANPELEAFYNAQRMQDLQLAAQSTQGGMDYAKFGAGMVGTGGDLFNSMYGTQQAAFAPYQTALGGAQSIENLGQGAMNLGTSLGSTTTAASAAAGRATQQGMLGAAQTMQPANSWSPWGDLLQGAGQAIGGMQQQQFDPYTGQRIAFGR